MAEKTEQNKKHFIDILKDVTTQEQVEKALEKMDILKDVTTQEQVEKALEKMDCYQLRDLIIRLQCDLENLTKKVCQAKGIRYVG